MFWLCRPCLTIATWCLCLITLLLTFTPYLHPHTFPSSSTYAKYTLYCRLHATDYFHLHQQLLLSQITKHYFSILGRAISLTTTTRTVTTKSKSDHFPVLFTYKTRSKRTLNTPSPSYKPQQYVRLPTRHCHISEHLCHSSESCKST